LNALLRGQLVSGSRYDPQSQMTTISQSHTVTILTLSTLRL